MEIYDIDIFSIFLKAGMIWKTNKWARTETLQQDVTRTGTQVTNEGYSTRHEYWYRAENSINFAENTNNVTEMHFAP
jgi:hypothetical protein